MATITRSFSARLNNGLDQCLREISIGNKKANEGIDPAESDIVAK